MLDVLHFYMEEDFDFTTKEESDAKENLRSTISRVIYDKDYSFSDSSSSSGVNSRKYINKEENEELKPFNPEDPNAFSKKSYIPPTDFDENSSKPFGDVLDSPIG